jgi:hypothetical protein
MAINYRDFIPTELSRTVLTVRYEDIPTLVSRINEWVEDQRIDVINMETVVFPMDNVRPEFENESMFQGYRESPSKNFQVVRVWFRD